MTEQWVVNASPLILLGKAGELAWVPLPGEVVVPAAVEDEVLDGSPEVPARRWLETPEGKSHVRDEEPVPEILAWDLGPGETAVLLSEGFGCWQGKALIKLDVPLCWNRIQLIH